jgi:hypothetical protein
MGKRSAYPPDLSLLASCTIGLNAKRNIVGDNVSPWNTPLWMGKTSVDQALVETKAVSLLYALQM